MIMFLSGSFAETHGRASLRFDLLNRIPYPFGKGMIEDKQIKQIQKSLVIFVFFPVFWIHFDVSDYFLIFSIIPDNMIMESRLPYR